MVKKSDDMAKYIAEDIHSRARYGDKYFGTVSVLDLTKLDKLNEAYGNYGKALLNLEKKDKKFLTRLGRETFFADNYGENNKISGYYNMVDIWSLANNTKDVTPIESEALMSAIDEAVVYNSTGKYRKSSHGISMYYPLDGDKSDVELYRKLKVANSDFVKLYKDIVGNKEIDISHLNGHDIYLDDDGLMTVNIGADNSEKVECVQEFNIQLHPDGKKYFLGSDERVISDWDKGIFKDSAAKEWLSMNGHIISTFLYSYNDDYCIFLTPIEVNGDRRSLQFVLDNDDGKFYPMYTKPLVEDRATSYASGYMDVPKIGDKITILHQLIDENWEMSGLEAGDTFTLQEELELYNVPLPDGDYIHQFMFKNARNNAVLSDTYKFTIENGEGITSK